MAHGPFALLAYSSQSVFFLFFLFYFGVACLRRRCGQATGLIDFWKWRMIFSDKIPLNKEVYVVEYSVRELNML